jgi:hypothetical protein
MTTKQPKPLTKKQLEKRIENIEYLLENGAVSGSQDEKQLKVLLNDAIVQLDSQRSEI